ncbi:MAG TPA: cellulose binding domain-containing protein [Kineosporiaceae bacterium]|nr:cellulose binding domain-containing protein [Kineosporiaceae bacterium]
MTVLGLMAAAVAARAVDGIGRNPYVVLETAPAPKLSGAATSTPTADPTADPTAAPIVASTPPAPPQPPTPTAGATRSSQARPSASASSVHRPASTPAAPTDGYRLAPTVMAHAATCSATYALKSWGGGFVVSVTVKNTSATPWPGWSGTVALPAAITLNTAWGGDMRVTDGTVRVVPAAYNANVPVGGQVVFGFDAKTGTAVNRIGSVSVNGSTCQAG